MIKVLILLSFLASCASSKFGDKVKVSSNYKKLIGKSFYVPKGGAGFFRDEIYYKGKTHELVRSWTFNYCKKAKLVGFLQRGSEYEKRKVPNGAVLFQDNKYYAVGGIDSFMNVKDFMTKLPFKKRTVSLKDGNFSSIDLMCKGHIWTGMTEKEFFFVKPSPERVNKTVSSRSIRKQVVYGSGASAEYYYLVNGILTSWQK